MKNIISKIRKFIKWSIYTVLCMFLITTWLTMFLNYLIRTDEPEFKPEKTVIRVNIPIVKLPFQLCLGDILYDSTKRRIEKNVKEAIVPWEKASNIDLFTWVNGNCNNKVERAMGRYTKEYAYTEMYGLAGKSKVIFYDSGLSDYKSKHITVHELGHVLGLDHNENLSIMNTSYMNSIKRGEENRNYITKIDIENLKLQLEKLNERNEKIRRLQKKISEETRGLAQKYH